MATQTPNQGYDDKGATNPLVGGDNPNTNASNVGNNSFYAGDESSRSAFLQSSKLDSSAASREDLGQSEIAGGSGASSAVGHGERQFMDKLKASDSTNKDGKSLYTGSAAAAGAGSLLSKVQPALFLKLRNKKAAGGGVIGLVVGLLIYGGSVAYGPFQLMQLSNILKKPLSSQENDTKTRMQGLLRFARSGEIGQTRVGYLGSRSFPKTEAKLSNVGLVADSKTAGAKRVISYKIDTKKFGSTSSPKVAAENFSRQTGIPMSYMATDNRGNFYVRNPDGGALPDNVSRQAIQGGLDEVYKDRKLGKTLVALKSRPVMNYNGAYSKLHPWKKLQARTMEKAAAIDAARKAKKAERSAKAKARAEKIQAKLKPVAAPIALAGGAQLGACVAKDVAAEIPLITYENVIQPAKNIAVEFISMGDQLLSGNDFTLSQPGAASKGLRDSEGGSVWQSKALNAMAKGDEGTGKDLDEDLKKGFDDENPGREIESGIDKLGGDTLCSTTGQLIGGGLGLVALAAAAPTGGTSLIAYGGFAAGTTAATIGAVQLITTVVPKLVAEKPLLADLDDAPLMGNVAAFGSEALSNDFAIKSGGAALSSEARGQLENEQRIADKQEFESRSFASRMFDLTDSRSLTASTLNNINTNPSEGLQTLGMSIFNFGDIASKLLSLATPKAFAAGEGGSYDFGFPKYGFSSDDINNPLMLDPYENADKAAALLEANDDYVARAKKCFGVELSKGTNGWQVDVAKNPDGDPEQDVLPSTNEYISGNCAEGNNDWLRIRLFIFDSRTMEAYACYEGEDDACAGVEAGGGSSDTDTSTGETATAVDGSAQELAQKIIDSGKITFQGAYAQQIKDVADGKKDCNVNPTILSLLATLAEKHTLVVTSLNRKCTSTIAGAGSASSHFKEGGGHAVDIGSVDGQRSTGATENDIALMKEIAQLIPEGSGIGQVDCRGAGKLDLPKGVIEFEDSCDHIHVQVPVKQL